MAARKTPTSPTVAATMAAIRSYLYAGTVCIARGLTSCLFLILSGFAFSIATARHWTLHTAVSPAILKRARRFGLFIALGYALHFPVARLSELSNIPAGSLADVPGGGRPATDRSDVRRRATAGHADAIAAGVHDHVVRAGAGHRGVDARGV